MSTYLEMMKRARADLARTPPPDDPLDDGRRNACGEVDGRAAGVVPIGTEQSQRADHDGEGDRDATTAAAALNRLAAIDVALRVEDGELHCRGSKGWLTPDLGALIASARDEMAALLAPATADDGRHPQGWPAALATRDGAKAVVLCCPYCGETHRHAWANDWPITPGSHLGAHLARCRDGRGGMVQLRVAPAGTLAPLTPSLRERVRQTAPRSHGPMAAGGSRLTTPTIERRTP